jgi:antirestriction protein ArdC
MMREYTVFNVDQCENLPDSVSTGKPVRVRNPDTRDELADAFLRSTGADIREGHGEACYVPSRDAGICWLQGCRSLLQRGIP